jgi:3-oxoacyl-[acyl-carrier-protein] synthase III
VADSAVYITATSAFLPGPPVENDDMEQVLGRVGGQPSRARRLILRHNGIRRRHYVIDRETGKVLYNNAQLTAEAVRGLAQGDFDLNTIDCLVCGTSMPDQLMPNHAVMVHGELGNPCCEVVATAGICVSGFSALKYAYLAVRAGDARNAVATASEVASTVLHARQFTPEVDDKVAELERRPELAFEKDFLRWMLSDGAGALLLQDRPRRHGVSLRIDWIDMFSYAHELPACMYAGGDKDEHGRLIGWREHEPRNWLRSSLFAVKQDVKLLNENVVPYTLIKPLQQLVRKRGLRAQDVHYFLPHMSSDYFREPIVRALAEAGCAIPEDRWFSNLSERGNTGAASPYIMLDGLYRSGRLRAGERLLMFVPESGRFSSAFALLTVI